MLKKLYMIVIVTAIWLVGCSMHDGLDVADPVISQPTQPQGSTAGLGPLANAYDVAPPPGLTPTETYDQFHREVLSHDTEGLYVYLSGNTRKRLSEVALAMSVTDAQTLIEGLLEDPQFAAFGPDESPKEEMIDGKTATVFTSGGREVKMVNESDTWRIDF